MLMIDWHHYFRKVTAINLYQAKIEIRINYIN